MLRGPLGSVALLRGMLNPLLRRTVSTAPIRYADDKGRKKSDGMFSWLKEMLRPEDTYIPKNPENPSNPTDSNPSSSLDPWNTSNPKNPSNQSNPSSRSNPSKPPNPSGSPKPSKRSSPLNPSKSYYSSVPPSMPPPVDVTPVDVEDKILIDDIKKPKDSYHVETIQPDMHYPIQSGGSPTVPKRQMKHGGDSSLVEDPQSVNLLKGEKDVEGARIQAMRNQDLMSVKGEVIQEIYEAKNYVYLRPEEMKNLRWVSRPRPPIQTESNSDTTPTEQDET